MLPVVKQRVHATSDLTSRRTRSQPQLLKRAITPAFVASRMSATLRCRTQI